MRILGVVAANAAGSTDALVGAVLAGAAAAGAETRALALGYGPLDSAAAGRELERGFDGIVLGAPTYRGRQAGVLKEFLDQVPREGPGGGFAGPLLAKPAAIVATGASLHHFLGTDELAAILSRFFAAYVVPPPLYAAKSDFEDGAVAPGSALASAAEALGSRLLALAAAIAAEPSLEGAAPQA